jgi:uncharacterized protein (TIGR02246 family)
MRPLPSAALLAACLLSACQSAPKPLSAADETAIKAVESAYATAMNAGNTDGILALYTADGMDLPPGQPPVSGQAALRTNYAGMFGAMNVTIGLTPSKISGGGNMAYVTGSYHFSATMKDTTKASGGPMVEDGKYVDIVVRQEDGSWKIALGAWSANTPPAPPAPAPAPAKRSH